MSLLVTDHKDLPQQRKLKSQREIQLCTRNLQEMLDKLIDEHPETKYLDKIESQRYLFSRSIKGYRSRIVVGDVKFVENFMKQEEEVKFRREIRIRNSLMLLKTTISLSLEADIHKAHQILNDCRSYSSWLQ